MSTNQKILIVIAGPTAVGKSSLAIDLAIELNADIFSADSRQIYKEMTIGTAKVTPKEQQIVKHHFIDIASINDDYNIGTYESQVIKSLETYYQSKDIALLVGGSGLYINAVLKGIDEFPEVDEKTVAELNLEMESKGLLELQAELKTKDPVYYEKVDKQNPRRIIRALSVIRSASKPFSHFLKSENKHRAFKAINIVLTLERAELYDRINKRVDGMIIQGLVEEAKTLYPLRERKALQTIAYKELFSFIEGAYDLDHAIEKIKQHSRNYAKRQLTWFKNNFEGKAFKADAYSDIKTYVLSRIKELQDG